VVSLSPTNSFLRSQLQEELSPAKAAAKIRSASLAARTFNFTTTNTNTTSTATVNTTTTNNNNNTNEAKKLDVPEIKFVPRSKRLSKRTVKNTVYDTVASSSPMNIPGIDFILDNNDQGKRLASTAASQGD